MAGTFSESWYRIARLHATLRAPVRCRKQFFRGEPWYFLHDPYNKNFYRLSPEYYRFVARLSLGKNIEDVWLETPQDLGDNRVEGPQPPGNAHLSGIAHGCE